MAIHPALHSTSPAATQPNQVSALSPQQIRQVSAWTEQAALSLRNLDLSGSMSPSLDSDGVVPLGPLSSSGNPAGTAGRFLTRQQSTATESPAVPVAIAPDYGNPTQPARASLPFRRREKVKQSNVQRDSTTRRETLLKGKDGSRRRQRWENGISAF